YFKIIEAIETCNNEIKGVKADFKKSSNDKFNEIKALKSSLTKQVEEIKANDLTVRLLFKNLSDAFKKQQLNIKAKKSKKNLEIVELTKEEERLLNINMTIKNILWNSSYRKVIIKILTN
ncbi:MAG: hypothetical protein ACRDD7_10930, partial [Peptostreptococcaceae bacterium]